MRLVAGLQDQFDLDLPARQRREGALVVHLVDVGAGLGDDGGDARERAGQVARRLERVEQLAEDGQQLAVGIQAP